VSDEWDLEALVERWRGPLVGWLRARGFDAGAAVELAQDVFAEAWLGRDRFAGERNDERAVGAWLIGIARNLARAARRAQVRAQGRAEGAGVQHELVDDSGDREDEASCAQHAAADVRAAIDRLPRAERTVVRAYYLEQSDTCAVAALIGRSERAVEGLLHRARRRMGAWLSSGAAR